jgi:hypothetical protein
LVTAVVSRSLARWIQLREAIAQGKQDIRIEPDLISAGVALQ